MVTDKSGEIRKSLEKKTVGDITPTQSQRPPVELPPPKDTKKEE